MTKLKRTLKTVFSTIFIGGGVMHFVKPEMGLGLALLLPKFTRAAAWGLVALLFFVFPANLNMAE